MHLVYVQIITQGCYFSVYLAVQLCDCITHMQLPVLQI